VKKILSPLILFLEISGVGLTAYELYRLYHPDGWGGLVAFVFLLYIIGFTLVSSLVGIMVGKLISNKPLFRISVALAIIYLPLVMYTYYTLGR
jgi:hypothetical protein